MPNEVKLLPCAFCSGEGLMHRAPWGWQVTCCECGAVPRNNSNANHETETGAAAVWNHRPTTVVTDEVVERLAREIEQYGEGLVPELRIVCTWLAAHFRNNDDARAALASMPTVVTGEQPQDLGAIPGSHPSGQAPSGLGASRFDPERGE